MSAEEGTCVLCGAKVPLEWTAEHLSEHGVASMEEIRNAPIVDETGEEDDE